MSGIQTETEGVHSESRKPLTERIKSGVLELCVALTHFTGRIISEHYSKGLLPSIYVEKRPWLYSRYQ